MRSATIKLTQQIRFDLLRQSTGQVLQDVQVNLTKQNSAALALDKRGRRGYHVSKDGQHYLMGHKRCDEAEFEDSNHAIGFSRRPPRTGPSRVVPDFHAGGSKGENRVSCTDPGGCCEVSVGAARQRAVVILATLVAFEVLDRLKFAIAHVATRAGRWTVDRIAVAPRPAMVAQHCQAVATHTARLANVFALGDGLGDPALLSLLCCARGRRSDVADSWGRRRDVAPGRILRGQQQAPVGWDRRA